MSYKQVIVVNKGLNMSRGKLSAQVSHASMAFLLKAVKGNISKLSDNYYVSEVVLEKEVYENWMNDSFTKVVLAVDNEEDLQAVVERAEERGMLEGMEYFCIRDNCLTELKPDETGTRWTCIGFKPMRRETIDSVTGGLKVYR